MTYDPFDPFNQLLTETPAHLLASGGFWVKQQFYDVVETVLVPKYAAVDVVGVIYKPTGKTLKTPEGPVPEMKAVPGWHANVRHTEEAPELDAYKVDVKTPSRMWA
jgi:hypothetical protein